MSDESGGIPVTDPDDTAPAVVPPSLADAPTPEERLAETLADDPDVGIDGTGVGELP